MGTMEEIAIRVAKKTYGETLKETGDHLKFLEDMIEKMRKEILAIHGRKDMSSQEYYEIMAQLVSSLKSLKKQYWDVETRLRRLVSEPGNESLLS